MGPAPYRSPTGVGFRATCLLALELIAVNVVHAQSPAWGQCGGIGWTGSTTCVSGWTCVYSNPYYSQCLEGSSSSPTTTKATTTPSTTTRAGTTASSKTTTTSAATTTSSWSGNGSGNNYNNPVLWNDLADLEIIRVNDTYYYSASTMAYSPGAPVLRSYDLINWEYIGHSVPTLDWNSKYNLANGQRAYVKGIWASLFGYRKSTGTYYWGGCIEFSQTYMYTATNPAGPWTKRSQINNCYYDAGLLIDDDDTMYVAYGNTNINVARLSSDGLSQVETRNVWNSPSSIGAVEGSRFYKINGSYYIFVTHPANQQWVLKASSPWGPYTQRQLLSNLSPPISGAGIPHQGTLISTPAGQWYYMAFIDSYPGGRMPVLAPITWGSDGYPTINTVNNAWGASYPYPLTKHPLKAPYGTDSFSGTSLGPEWEWNHNPDTSKFSVNNGLTLSTATVTTDLYSARNTLTHRILGPISIGTIVLEYGNMADGDRAGLAMFRDKSAWIGIVKSGSSTRISFWTGMTLSSSDWSTTSTGSEAAGASISGSKVWLRIYADIRPGGTRTATFSYSTDGNSFSSLGGGLVLNNDWTYFIGYRFGIFNFATKSLGGSVKVDSFTMNLA
ncbi:Beta-xylosidase [Arthrobotrys entomopaga]|nr:Beta-xylosidase [Arthrobotrys entomopaga]